MDYSRHYSLDCAAVLSVVSRPLKFKRLYVVIVNRFALFVLKSRSNESRADEKRSSEHSSETGTNIDR
jgi:hypothetical protein